MKSKYSPRQKPLKVNGEIIKRDPKESLSQYWARVEKITKELERTGGDLAVSRYTGHAQVEHDKLIGGL